MTRQEIYPSRARTLVAVDGGDGKNHAMRDDLVPTFCPLCVSRCGAKAVVKGGEFVELLPNPDHPTGSAICLKGKAAP